MAGVDESLEAERVCGLEVERADEAVRVLLGWMVWRGRRGGCMVHGGGLAGVVLERVGEGQ